MAKTVSRKIVINLNGKEIEDSLSGIGKEIGRIKKEIRATSDPAQRKKLNAQLQVSRKRYKEVNDEIRQTAPLLSRIKKQIGPVGVAMASAFSVAAIFELGKKVVETIQLFRELKHETKQLTGLQGAFLDQAVSGTKALADTFETDYKQNLEAANALSKQFGVSYEEALSSMEKGYLAGANVSGDMLEQLKEYAPLMKESNIELDQMVALIAQTEKEGIFNDKGIDTIKEGMLRIREGTKNTREAMQGLGLDSANIYDQLSDGSTNYFEVMQLISSKLGEVEQQSPEVGAAIADIFGGAGEDAGLEYLQSIKDIDLQLDGLIDTTDKYTQLKQEEIAINEKLNSTWVNLTETGGFFNQVALLGKSVLADILFGFQDLDKVLQDNKTKSDAVNLDENEKEFRAHMARMKTALGDRYNYEELRANYASRIQDESISTQILGLEKLETEKIKTTSQGARDLLKLEKKAAAAKAKSNKETVLKAIETLAEKVLLESLDLNDKEIQIIENKYDKLLELAVKGSDEEAQLKELKQQEIDAKKLQQHEAFELEKKKIQDKYNVLTNDELRAEEIAALKVLFDEKKIAHSDYLLAIKDIDDYYKQVKEEEQLAEDEKKAEEIEEAFALQLETEALTDEERYAAEVERLDALLAQKLISQEQYQAAIDRLEGSRARKRLEKAMFAIQAVSNLVQAAKQNELAGIEEVTKRKGETEDEYLKRKEEVEAKKAEINKKYALIEMLTSIAQIGTSTALAIMSAWATAGNPYLGAIFAALIGGVGIFQTKAAVDNYKKVKGYAEGGPTGSGLGYSDDSGHAIAGVVHANEYVVPEFIAQDPVYADTLGFLEQKRTEGLGKGYAEGGAVTEAPETSSAANTTTMALEQLVVVLSNGIVAHALIGDDEIERQQARQNVLIQTRDNAKIK